MKQRVWMTVLLLLSGTVFSQGISITDVIPPIPIPPKISNVTDNSASAQTGDVTVTANITTYATTKFHDDGTNRWIEFLPVPGIDSAQLCYSLDYDTGNPPTWTCNDMTVSLQTDNSSDSTWPHKIFQATGTIPGQPEGTKVTYIIEAEDTYSNADNGVGHNKSVMRRSPADGPGIGTSWNDEKTNLAGETTPPSGNPDETQTFANPPNVPSSSMVDDLDVLEFRVANGGTSTNKFYGRVKVQGTVNAGSSDLSAAFAYVIAVVNMKRPPLANPPNVGQNDSDLARGVFALLWFENASQTGGAIPTNPAFVDAEATVAENCGENTICPSGQASNPLVSRAPGDPSNTLTLVTNLSNLDSVTADPSHPLYDEAFIVLAATAKVDASDLNNVSFVINDVINGTRYYPTNKSYTVEVCQTCPTFVDVTVNFKDASGDTVGLTGTAKLMEGTTEVDSISLNNATSVTFSQLDKSKSYEIVLIANGYFTAEVTPDLSSAGPTLILNATMYDAASGGDINGDNTVDRNDLDTLITGYEDYKNNNSYDPNLDLNDDGKISLIDVGILLKNYGQTAN